jgi:hypothetical protein
MSLSLTLAVSVIKHQITVVQSSGEEPKVPGAAPNRQHEVFSVREKEPAVPRKESGPDCNTLSEVERPTRQGTGSGLRRRSENGLRRSGDGVSTSVDGESPPWQRGASPSRSLSEPLIGVATLSVALIALAASWAHGMGAWQTDLESPTRLLLALCSIVAITLAYQFPICVTHAQLSTHVESSS